MIALIIPTYNERDSLPRLVQAVLNLSLPLQIIIVDDNSPDGTGKWADNLAAKNSAVRVIHRPRKLGLGTAYKEGFRVALESKADYIMGMDADYSHDPQYLPLLWEKAQQTQADIVIGSRYTKDGRMDSPWHRRVLSAIANSLVHRLLSLKARDATSGFRCYKATTLAQLPLERVTASGYSFLFEMSNLIERSGGVVAEVPIVFHDRSEGQSKISWREVWQSWRTIWRLRRDNRASQ